jgi:hypothetical protein
MIIVYFQLRSEREQLDYQVKASNLNQKIVELERQISYNKQKEDSIKDWKNYEDEEFGIQFKYPIEWFKLENKNKYSQAFLKKPQISVFGVTLINNKTGESLEEIAKNKLTENGCPADRIIGVDNNGVLYVTECGAMSEIYNYIFKNKKGEVIQFTYHDDFDSNWSEDKKLEKFKQIINTTSLF